MATPTIARFSPILQSPRDVLVALEPDLARLQSRVLAVGRLGIDEEGEMAFRGGETPCGSMAEAFEIAEPWGDFAVELRATPPKTENFIYFWRREETWLMALELPSPTALFQSEKWETGLWIRQFLVAAGSAAKVEIGAFGMRYDDALFEGLDRAQMLKDLRKGLLFTAGDLTLHLIRQDLISAEEMKDLLARYKTKDVGFRYGVTPTGYHVFDTLGPG